MIQEQFIVANLHCGGCANNVQQTLERLVGVEAVAVVVETGQVTVTHDGSSDVHTFTAALDKLGYPATENNNTLKRAKSYVSCMIGKLS